MYCSKLNTEDVKLKLTSIYSDISETCLNKKNVILLINVLFQQLW